MQYFIHTRLLGTIILKSNALDSLQNNFVDSMQVVVSIKIHSYWQIGLGYLK